MRVPVALARGAAALRPGTPQDPVEIGMADDVTQSTRQESSEEAARLVRTLAALCRDSESGYRRAYEDTRDRNLRVEFGNLVDEREDMAEALARCLEELGQSPVQGGTVAGAAHRIFLDLRAALSQRDREAVLREIVRGESAFEAAFDAALKAELPAGVRGILRHQHRLVRRSRDRFRSMLPEPSETPSTMGETVDVVVSTIREKPALAGAMLTAVAAGFLAALWLAHPDRR